MDRGTRGFWTVVIVLASASAFFGVRAESVRRSVQRASAAVQTGDLVTFSKALDGDTVLLSNAAGDGVTVRLIGIKSFDSTGTGDPTSAHGREAVAELQRALANKPVRVMLASPPKDAHGRTLATLFADDEDVALSLVRAGRVMVYTQYPFPAMAEYLREQDKARADRRGLWADPVASERAKALAAQWRKGAP
ncbi:MAG: thermonuclease family protein [Deltaproteobacteria bacterium]|nr:thermonuclease family protein [Deltaproteobacteria bacterium]